MSSPSGSTTDPPGGRSAECRDGGKPWKVAAAALSRLVVGAGTVAVGLVAGVVSLAAATPVDVPLLVSAVVLTLAGTLLLGLPWLRPYAGRAVGSRAAPPR